MQTNNSKTRCAFWARGFAALWAVLMLAFGAGPAEAAPFAWVANFSDNTVSVIDIASNTVTATVGVGTSPFGVAVSPEGKFVYVANFNSNNVSVIAAASNTVTATVGGGGISRLASRSARTGNSSMWRISAPTRLGDRRCEQHGHRRGRGGECANSRGHHAADGHARVAGDARDQHRSQRRARGHGDLLGVLRSLTISPP